MAKKDTEVKETKRKKTCSICFRDFRGFGNNAEPINSGRCCDGCNNLVIMARMNKMIKS